MNTIELNATRTKNWYCDSGASCHITWCKELLTDYQEFTTPEIILVGKAGEFMKALESGTVHIKSFHSGKWHATFMKNVRYVPEASANLFSVKAAAKKGYEIVLNSSSVVLRRKYNRGILATGRLQNNLYVMNFKVTKSQHFGTAKLVTTADTLQSYRERLGHQDKNYVKQFLKRMNI